MTARTALVLMMVLCAVPFAAPLVRGELPFFRDHEDYYQPLRWETARVLRTGALPMWNPWNGSGEPWLANPQTGVFYPPAWVFLFAPFRVAYLIFLWFHLTLLTLGAWLLFREWSTTSAALAGAVGLAFSGPALSSLDVQTSLCSLAWLPLILYTALRTERSEPLPRMIPAVLLAFCFLAGEPLIAAIGASLFAAAWLVVARRRLLDLAFVAGMSALLAAPQLLPFLSWIRGSNRARGLGVESALDSSLNPLDWVAALVSPALMPGRMQLFPLSQRFVSSLYIGVPVLLFMLAAVVSFRRDDPFRRVALFFGAIGATAALLSAGAYLPWIHDAFERLHLDVIRYPSRLAVFVVLAVCAFAAAGVDRFASFPLRTRVALSATAVVCGAAAIVRMYPDGWEYVPVRLAYALTGAAIAALAPLLPRLRRTGAVLLIVFTGLDLIHAGGTLLQTAPMEPTSRPYDGLVGSRGKVARVYGSGDPAYHTRRAWMSGYLNLYDLVPDAATPAPVMPASYGRFHEAATAGGRADLRQFLGITHVLGRADLGGTGLRYRGRVDDVLVWASPAPLPEVSFWTSVVDAASDEEAVRLLLEQRVSPQSALMVTRPPREVLAALDPAADPQAAASLVYEPSKVTIHARTAAPAIVVLAQTDDGWWRVRVDGRDALPLRAAGIFRAVFIPAGTHLIEWVYDPLPFRIGTVLGVAGVTVATVESLLFLRRRRRAFGTARAPFVKSTNGTI